MRQLVGTLGKFQSKLSECWGFDCLYGGDDAAFWYQWTSGKLGRPLYIFYGPSTIRQSVKLDLMGRGKATPQGNLAVPPGRQISNLNVSIGDAGISEARLDEFMTHPPPGHKSPTKAAKPRDGDYVKQAADNLRANVHFMDDIHYFIAREFFLSRLRQADFL
jgi:hypothetical protein